MKSSQTVAFLAGVAFAAGALLTCSNSGPADASAQVVQGREYAFAFSDSVGATFAGTRLLPGAASPAAVPGCDPSPSQEVSLLCVTNAMGADGWDCDAQTVGQAWCKRAK